MAQADNAHDAPAPPAEVAQAPEHVIENAKLAAKTKQAVFALGD